MRAVVQRVSRARVLVAGAEVGKIGKGLLVLAGVTDGDTRADAETLATKLAGLRVFADDDGKMNRSLTDVGGSALVVSQFTVYGSVRRGRRPSFTAAAPPDLAEPLVGVLADALRDTGVPVETGRFGAMMEVELVNDGPVTLVIETADGTVV